MSEDKLSIQTSALKPAESRVEPERVRPKKNEQGVSTGKPVVDSEPVKSPRISPVEDIDRIEKIGDRGLAIATETFSGDRIREKVQELEAALPKTSNSLTFQVDEVLKRPVITVIDKNSGEVVRTLPSEEVLRVVHNIDRMKGILFEDEF